MKHHDLSIVIYCTILSQMTIGLTSDVDAPIPFKTGAQLDVAGLTNVVRGWVGVAILEVIATVLDAQICHKGKHLLAQQPQPQQPISLSPQTQQLIMDILNPFRLQPHLQVS